MKLLFKNTCIGTIGEISTDQPWFSGVFEPKNVPSEISELFEYLTDENRSTEEPPFPPELLDSSNWHIEDTGIKKQIEVPAVHPDGAIMWRWY